MSGTREKFTDSGDQIWAIKSPEGAVDFHIMKNDQPGAITLHSADPRRGFGTVGSCRVLHGSCYTDASFVAGRDLHRAWLDSGRDDETIWGALEAWHDERFAGKEA